MGRELKRHRAPVPRADSGNGDPSSPLASRFAPDVTAASVFGQTLRARWFEIAAGEPTPPAMRRQSYVAGAVLVLALVLATFGRGLLLRAALPLVLASIAVWLIVRATPKRRAAKPRPAGRGLSFDGERVVYVDSRGIEQLLLKTSSPFGVTLVANRPRTRVVAAVSSADGAFYVGATLDHAAKRSLAARLARTSTVAADEVALEAIGVDGEPLNLAPSDLFALVDELERTSPPSAERVVLSDARGRPVLLDGAELLVAELRFDLTAPLEWRAIVFQEPFGQAVAVYQGTWVRQGSSEVVLVSLLPSIGGAATVEPKPTGVSELDRASLRDARLMQASAEAPPPADQRVAIERLFMLPLRSALDGAPRPSHASRRARA